MAKNLTIQERQARMKRKVNIALILGVLNLLALIGVIEALCEHL